MAAAGGPSDDAIIPATKPIPRNEEQMSDKSDSTVCNLEIDAEERAELLTLLERELSEARVEAHRTHTPNFRENVLHQEAVLRRLLQKLNTRCD
jgi:hypothetical protein